jgi:hypothetical protein
MIRLMDAVDDKSFRVLLGIWNTKMVNPKSKGQ